VSWKNDGLTVKPLYSIPGIATQILISTADGADILLDCGIGAVRDLLNHYGKVDMLNKISGVLITHEHLDHVAGLYALLDFMRLIGRSEDLVIASPKPALASKSFIEILKNFHGEGICYSFKLIEVSDKTVFNVGPVAVESFKVFHRSSTRTNPRGPLIPAVGYSLRYNDLRVVFSGDTGYFPKLEEKFKGADLAVIEATWMNDKGITEVHLTEREATRLGNNAKSYLLIHKGRDLEKFL